MLESENNNHVTESCDQFLPIMWESDGRLDHVTIESYDLSHEGIGDDDRRSPTADCWLPTANRQPPTANRWPLTADRRPPTADRWSPNIIIQSYLFILYHMYYPNFV